MEFSTCVAAVDPGETIGFCCVHIGNIKRVAAAEYRSAEELVAALNKHRPQVVILEDFRLYPETAKSLSRQPLGASEIAGVVAYWCSNNWAELVRRPAAARTVVKPILLRRLGWEKALRNKPHARDAAKHLAVWLVKHLAGEVAKVLAEEGTECDRRVKNAL